MATPVQIKSQITNNKSQVIVDGGKTIDISLVPDAKIGDWLLVHGDLAIQKIKANQAKEIFGLIKSCHHIHHK